MDLKKYFKKYISIVFLLALFLNAIINAQPIEIYDSGELQTALQKLNVLGSVLYIAAHPDDENTEALAYFSKGRKYRTAYLSLTRGDGGQNLIGSEKGVEIGIIRTQELLEGRKFDKAEQFFTRAIDFGYSKTPEEAFDFWGRDKILADIVWVIRKFRPDVIISRNSGGHGHHTAATLLAPEAFKAAADPNKYPEQLKYVQPWQAKRIFANSARFGASGQKGSENLITINLGEYNPLLAKSYTEIAAESRSMHKTQGLGGFSARRGTRNDNYQVIDGEPAKVDIFDGIDTSWGRIPGGQGVGKILDNIIKSFDPQNPSKSIPQLLAVNNELNKIDKSYWVEIKQQELFRVIQSSAGLWMEATSNDFAASPSDEIRIRTTLVNRADYPFKIEKIDYSGIITDSNLNTSLKNNEPVTIDKTLRIPEDYPISQPYWLREEPSLGAFSISEQTLIGLAENPPSFIINITLSIDGNLLEYKVPLSYRWVDRVEGELYRPFEVRPKVTLNLEDKVCIFPDANSREIKVNIKSNSMNVTGEIRFNGPEKWQIKPARIPFSLANKYEEKLVIFRVSPPRELDETVLVAEAEINKNIYNRDLVEIAHPHIESQVYFPLSQVKVVKLDIKKLGSKIGYIMGSGDEIPDGLRNLGYDVILLNDEALENIDFSQFDAIITGVRAYNTRERLIHTQPKILQYVENGGTLIVQYNVPSGLLTREIGPYPFTIGQDRVCVETAPISFLNPNHQLLNFPNKITQKDFEGWVQERGLYFATQWDEKYEPILSSHDPNEPDRKGGILFTRYGKGVFIFTGLAWFRQLPAGVPGAYRIFANLISAGKYNGK